MDTTWLTVYTINLEERYRKYISSRVRSCLAVSSDSLAPLRHTVETETTPATLTNTETYCTSDVNSAPSNSSCWQQNRINHRIGVKQTTVKQQSIDAVCLSDCAIWSSACFISVCLRRFVVSVYFAENHTLIPTPGLCWTYLGQVDLLNNFLKKLEHNNIVAYTGWYFSPTTKISL